MKTNKEILIFKSSTIKRFSTLTIAILLLISMSCKNENTDTDNRTAKTQSTQKNINNGTFTATLGDKEYNVAVRCQYLKEDYFIFDSDSTGGTKDTNGDGIIISGNQDGQVVSLIIKDNGKSYSAGNISISKSKNEATGSGTLFPQTGGAALKVSYKVICN